MMLNPITWGAVAKHYTTDPHMPILTKVPYAGQGSARVLRHADTSCRYHDNNMELHHSLLDGNPYLDTPRLLREAVKHPTFQERTRQLFDSGGADRSSYPRSRGSGDSRGSQTERSYRPTESGASSSQYSDSRAAPRPRTAPDRRSRTSEAPSGYTASSRRGSERSGDSGYRSSVATSISGSGAGDRRGGGGGGRSGGGTRSKNR